MKTILPALFALAAISANGTIHTVSVSNFQFSPASVTNVLVGDTMRWVWVSGNHTTTDNPLSQPGTSLPEGAATWDAIISAGSPSFDYRVVVAGVYNYWCKPHAPEMAGSFTATGVMPVKLAGFSAAIVQGKAVLQWKTTDEQNLSYFSIQKSQNGASFNEAAKISPSASQQGTYTYTDPAITNGKYYYYKLTMVDVDGSKQVSETKMIKTEGKIDKLILSVGPNPVKSGALTLTFNAWQHGIMTVIVSNLQGQPVLKTQLPYSGVNSAQLHLGNVAPGTYNITFLLNGIKETRSIVVQ